MQLQLNSARRLLVVLGLVCAITVSGCDRFASPQTRLERARAQVEKGDRRAALVELKNALQKAPDLHEARLLLAELALWAGDVRSADAELQRVPSNVAPAEADELRARVDLALGRSEQLLLRLGEGGAAMPPARAEMYRGVALLQQQKPQEAEAALRKAIETDAVLAGAHAGLIEALSAQGKERDALELSERLVREHPDSADIWATRATLLARDSADDALQALERARALAPQQFDVVKQSMLLAALVDMYLSAGKVEAARSCSEELSRLNPGSAVARVATSRIAMASNDYVGAANELRRVVNAAPGLLQARFLLGVALAAQGNLEQASSELAQLVEQAPQFLEARQLLGQVKMRLNDPDGALQVLVPGLQADGSNLQLSSLIDAARLQARSGAAVDALERELAANPDNASVETELAAAYVQSGAAAKALQLLRKSGVSSPDARREALLLQATLDAEGPRAARSRVDALLASRQSEPKIAALGAAFLARLGDVEAGRQLLKSRLAATPGAQELYFALAQLEWSARQPAAARAALQRLLDSNPKHTQAQLALAEIELATGNRQQAQKLLDDVRSLDPRATRVRLLLASLALAENDPARAAELVDEALRTGENPVELRASAGMLYLNAGRYDQAIQHLQQGLKLDARAAPLWLQLGRAQLALNQHGPARESLERALELRPRWFAAEGALVFLELQSNNADAALARVAALKQAQPQDGAVASLEGHALFALRRYAESAAAFDRAAQLQPNAAHAANSYRARLAGKLPDAAAALERWVQRNPQDAAARLMLAEAHARAGEPSRAIRHYEQVLASQPENAQALNNAAWIYYELKDARALELARKASALAPDAAAVSDTLGWILVESGKVEEGLPVLERAATQAASEPEIGFHYAAALIRAGQVERGTAYLRRLLKEHPSFPSRAEAQRLAGAG